MPAGWSYEAAATLPCAGVTAWHALFVAAAGRIAGDVPVPLAHPRSLGELDAAMASATAGRVRELLALDREPEDPR